MNWNQITASINHKNLRLESCSNKTKCGPQYPKKIIQKMDQLQ
jgi:hypothetical protein